MNARPDPTPAKPCPICGKPADTGLRPFCSRRCADIDLHRWLSGTYSIPAVETDEEEHENASGPADRDENA